MNLSQLKVPVHAPITAEVGSFGGRAHSSTDSQGDMTPYLDPTQGWTPLADGTGARAACCGSTWTVGHKDVCKSPPLPGPSTTTQATLDFWDIT